MSGITDLSLRSNLQEITASLTEFERQQLPFATALALTRCAQQAKIDLQAEMKKRFDRPTPYTLNSLYVRPATKTRLEASVEIKDEAVKGNPATKFLAPEIDSGGRNMKGFEKLLDGLSGGMFAFPSDEQELDAYGNLSKGKLTRLLSRLEVLRNTGYQGNITEKTRAKLRKKGLLNYWTKGKRMATSDYFIAFSKRNNKPLGVWQFMGKHQVKPVLIFTDKTPTYRQRLPFNEIVFASVNRNFTPALTAALSKAIATAQPRNARL